MRTGNLKKYIVPNIPYLFIGWAFLKFGTAYRMAAGADLLSKVMGIGQTIGVAFADFAPGLNPMDWLVGIVGGRGVSALYPHEKQKRKEISAGCGVRIGPMGPRKRYTAFYRSQV